MGFSSLLVYPKGKVNLKVKVNDAYVKVEFIVVDVPSPYNAIMGQTWLHNMQVVPSTHHQKFKFPLENGKGKVKVTTVKGDQISAKQCLMAATLGGKKAKQVQMAEVKNESELEQVGREPQ